MALADKSVGRPVTRKTAAIAGVGPSYDMWDHAGERMHRVRAYLEEKEAIGMLTDISVARHSRFPFPVMAHFQVIGHQTWRKILKPALEEMMFDVEFKFVTTGDVDKYDIFVLEEG